MLRHLLESGDTETALQVAGRSLSEYWLVAGGQFTEGRAWLERALSLVGCASARARAWGLYGIAILSVHQFDLLSARIAATDALALAVREDDPELVIQCRFTLSLVDEAEGRFAEAEALAVETVARARMMDNPGLLGWSLVALGNVWWHTGDLPGATAALEEALALFRGCGGVWGETDALTILAWIAQAAGDLERAATLHADALTLRRDAGETVGTFNDVIGMASIGQAMGHADAAARLLGAEEAYRAATGYQGFGETPALRNQTRQALRDQLGDERFGRAWAAGQALSPEQASVEALESRTEAAALAVRAGLV
jgi:non-specific serine/threonine protein kinase